LCTILFLPTVMQKTVFLQSHITSSSYVFWCLLTPSSGSFISTAVPSQLLFVCEWWGVRLDTFCYEFTHWIHIKIILYFGSILFTSTYLTEGLDHTKFMYMLWVVNWVICSVQDIWFVSSAHTSSPQNMASGGHSGPLGCDAVTRWLAVTFQRIIAFIGKVEVWGPSGTLAKEHGSPELLSDCAAQRAC
jgi:hypothetical protein